jgi:hypothetical protein
LARRARSLGAVTSTKIARVWFGLTAAAVFIGILVRLFVAAGADGPFPTVSGRLFNVFCYFTIQSNIIVGVTSLLLAIRPDRSSMAFRVFRLDGVVCIAITAVVYHTSLAHLVNLQGMAVFSDKLMHTVCPALYLGGWLLFGPWGAISLRVIRYALIFPLTWLAFTLLRGPIVDFYPYPFLDVRVLGYPRVALNAVVISALFFLLASGAAGVDRLRSRNRTAAPEPEPTSISA